MNEDINNQDDELNAEEIAFNAYVTFNKHFADYINEVEPDVFKRARDYARDCTEQDMGGKVRLIDPRDIHESLGENDEMQPGDQQ